jgi:hypothetical protein
MASQAQLEADIALARAQVASLELQLDAAAGSPQPDPAVIADLERQLNTARIALAQLQTELNNLLVVSDPNTNIGTEAQVPEQQQTINPNSDPNTNIGAEGQDVTGFEPLTEPPSTADEFDGIDTQIDNNENALQEPPLLSDEEIDQQIGLAAAQEETITSPDSITENVFDPRQDAQESVFDPRQEVTENVFDPTAGGSGQGISTALNNTRSTATKQDTANFQQKPDWRARLSLAPNSNYLYNN